MTVATKTNYKHLHKELVDYALAHGYTYEEKGCDVLKDYGGMNSMAASPMGYRLPDGKPMPDKTVYISISSDDERKLRDTRHEFNEDYDMRVLGWPYWKAHKDSLDAESRSNDYVMQKISQCSHSTAKINPATTHGKALLADGQFKARDKALESLGSNHVVEVHDDGDLTVKHSGNRYVVTTEGNVFEEVKPIRREETRRILIPRRPRLPH